MESKKIFHLIRCVSVIVIATLFFAVIATSIIANFYLHDSFSYIFALSSSIYGDSFVLLMLFLGALYFRSRYCAVGAVIVAFADIFLRLSSAIIFTKTFMPLDYSTLKLLFIHTNFETLQVVAGSNFYFWMVPAVLVWLAAVFFCCTLVWKTAGKEPRKFSRNLSFIVSALALLSLASNILFLFQHEKQKTPNAAAPLPVVVGELIRDYANDTIDEQKAPIPLPQESREFLIKEGVIADVEKTETEQVLFDRIIIVAIESLDYHYLSRNNPKMPEKITPALDRFSAEYVSMNNYFAAAQPTSWGITALILSRLDFEADKSNRTTSLFTIARKKQFCSYYFSAAPGYLAQDKGYYKQMFDPDIQFFREEFFDKYNFGVENEWGLSDRTLYSGVFKELKECQAERFIAVISTIDTHPPYHHSELTPEEEKSFPNVFLQSLYSADRELNVFIQKIMQDPKLYNERTLIILTSDHTATHGENYTKRKIFSPERIPLIFITPNQKIFQKLDRNKYASSIDLAPTILSLIGCEIPSSFMGRSLFSEKNRAITSYGHFLIVHSPDEQNLYINMKAPEGILQTAYRDFYYSYYGK